MACTTLPSAACRNCPRWPGRQRTGDQAVAWNGYVAPAGAGAKTLDLLNAALEKALLSPAVRQQLNAQPCEVPAGPRQALFDLAKRERPVWADVIRRSGAKLDAGANRQPPSRRGRALRAHGASRRMQLTCREQELPVFGLDYPVARVPPAGPGWQQSFLIFFTHLAGSAFSRCYDCGIAGESPSWLRHWILIPACEGSNPSSPATISTPVASCSRGFFVVPLKGISRFLGFTRIDRAAAMGEHLWSQSPAH